MSARDDYPELARRNELAKNGFHKHGMHRWQAECSAAFDEIDRLRAKCVAWERVAMGVLDEFDQYVAEHGGES